MIATLSNEFVKARSVNATDSSFPSRIPTTTEPSADGVIDLAPLAGRVADNLLLIPYGTGSENDTFDLRVIGWRKVDTLWIPVILAEVACTLSAAVGVASAPVINSERFVDTLSLTIGNQNASAEVVSPGDDVLAHLMLDVKGFSKVEITFAIDTGATGMNALYCVL